MAIPKGGIQLTASNRSKNPDADRSKGSLEPRLHELARVLGRAVARKWRQECSENERTEKEPKAAARRGK